MYSFSILYPNFCIAGYKIIVNNTLNTTNTSNTNSLNTTNNTSRNTNTNRTTNNVSSNALANTGSGHTGGIIAIALVVGVFVSVYSYRKFSEYKNI